MIMYVHGTDGIQHERVMLRILGRGYAARQTGGCRSKLQRSPRGSNEEHPSIALQDRELCFVGILEIAGGIRHATVGLSTIHLRQEDSSTGWLFRPVDSGTFESVASRTAVYAFRPTIAGDGRSSNE